MANALYRKSGGEVVKISATQTWPDVNSTYWGVLVAPTFTDGTEYRDPNEDLRVLGYAKINDAGTVRNATQPEIDNFITAETADDDLMDAQAAEDLFLTHPQFRKLMTAFADVIKDELNILRGWLVDYKAEVAAATSLPDLQSRVAALPDLADRTLLQVKTQVQNRISEND